jgi:ribosomal protein L5
LEQAQQRVPEWALRVRVPVRVRVLLPQQERERVLERAPPLRVRVREQVSQLRRQQQQ